MKQFALILIVAAGTTIHVSQAQRNRLASVRNAQVQAALQLKEVKNNDTADLLVRLLSRP